MKRTPAMEYNSHQSLIADRSIPPYIKTTNQAIHQQGSVHGFFGGGEWTTVHIRSQSDDAPQRCEKIKWSDNRNMTSERNTPI